MKKRIKIIVVLSCVFLLSMAALVISSCTLKRMTREDVIEEGYVYTVTYDYQGGKAKNFEKIDLQVKPDSFCPEPGTITTGKGEGYFSEKPVLEGFVIDGYYLGEKDENGNVTYTRKWNFKTDKVNENITLYVKWRGNYSLIVNYVDNTQPEGSQNKTYTTTVGQTSDGAPNQIKAPTLTGYTVLGFYFDREYKQAIEFPYQPTSEDLSSEKTEFNIYANVLVGTWNVVETAKDLTSFAFGTGSNVYLLDDIDMNELYGEINWNVDWNDKYNAETIKASDAISKFTIPANYNGKFYGNGHKISNLRIRQEQEQSDKSNTAYGIFKKLDAKAEIKDVTFENVTFDVKITNAIVNNYYVGMFAGTAAKGAKVENVTVTGTLNCDIITNNGVAERTDILPFFGDDMENCTPVNCNYAGVTIIKNGEAQEWE